MKKMMHHFLRYFIFFISTESLNFKIYDVTMGIIIYGAIYFWSYFLNYKKVEQDTQSIFCESYGIIYTKLP